MAAVATGWGWWVCCFTVGRQPMAGLLRQRKKATAVVGFLRWRKSRQSSAWGWGFVCWGVWPTSRPGGLGRALPGYRGPDTMGHLPQ